MAKPYYPYGNPGTWGRAGRPSFKKTKKIVKKSSGTGGAAWFPGGYSDAQIRAQAAAWADAQIKVQQAYLDRQREIIKQDMKLAYDRQIASGLALAEWQKANNFPGQIQGIFGGLASDQAALAKGYGGAAAAAANADAAEIARQNAGLGVDAAVRNQSQNISDVTYGLGGALPAQAMNTSGANYAAAATNLPGYAVQAGQYYASQAQAEEAKRMNDLLTKYDELIRSRPELVQQGLDTAYARQKTKYDIYADQRNAAIDKYEQDRRYNLDKFTVEMNARIATDELTLAQAEYLLDKYEAENPPAEDLDYMDIMMNGVKTRVGVNPSTGKIAVIVGPSGSQPSTTKSTTKAKAVAARDKEIARVKNDTTRKAKEVLGVYVRTVDGVATEQSKKRKTREQLIKYLVAYYMPNLKRFGVKASALRAIIAEVVNTLPAAWFKPAPYDVPRPGGTEDNGGTSDDPFAG